MNYTIFTDDAGIALNSATDLNLIEKSFKNKFPKRKEKTIDVPGMNGVLDLSNSLTGYPLYKQRDLSWTFAVKPEFIGSYEDIVANVAASLLGRKMTIEKSELTGGWKFTGVITEITEKRDGAIRTIDVSASCFPYMTKDQTVTVESSALTFDWTYENASDMRFVPEFTPTKSGTLYFGSYHMDLTAGVTTSSPSVSFKRGLNTVRYIPESAGCTLTVTFKEGRL